jgi:hypothetical protein
MARKRLALALFVQATASLTKDGECVSCGKDGYEPNPYCHTHAPWDMRNDGAVETLNGLISNARRLNGQGEEEVPHNLPQDDLIVANSGHGCSTCCREHNMCLECGHKPFATDNTGILYHYFLSCNHRDEDSVYCDCHCGCQCGVCRRQREAAPGDSPSGNAPTADMDEPAGT